VVRGRPGHLRWWKLLLADGEWRADVGPRGMRHGRGGVPAAWREGASALGFGHTSSKHPSTTFLTKWRSFSLLLDSGEEEQPIAMLSKTMGPRFRHDSATAR
jgi:hypothetical protein